MIKTYDEALSFIHGRTQFKKIPTLFQQPRFYTYMLKRYGYNK